MFAFRFSSIPKGPHRAVAHPSLLSSASIWPLLGQCLFVYVSLSHVTSEAMNPLRLFKSLACPHKVSHTLLVLLASPLHLRAYRMIVSAFSDTRSPLPLVRLPTLPSRSWQRPRQRPRDLLGNYVFDIMELGQQRFFLPLCHHC